MKPPAIRARPYHDEADFYRIRDLLIQSYGLSQRMHNWSLRHWEGDYFHRADASEFPTAQIHLWQTDSGIVVGAVHPDYSGEASIEIHPDYRHLEAEMIAWAEQHLSAARNDEARPTLDIWVYEYDTLRQSLLESLGYQRHPGHGYCRRRPVPGSIPQAELAPGYTIRGMQISREDQAAYTALLNAAFNRTFHSQPEYARFQTAPSYRPELDRVVIAPDGTFAAAASVTIDTANNYAEFEPVCTHPQHQRKGLARAVMAAGLWHLQELGVAMAYVFTGENPAANHLYEAMGFVDYDRFWLWQKQF